MFDIPFVVPANFLSFHMATERKEHSLIRTAILGYFDNFHGPVGLMKAYCRVGMLLLLAKAGGKLYNRWAFVKKNLIIYL